MQYFKKTTYTSSKSHQFYNGSSFNVVPADGYVGRIWSGFSVCKIYEQCDRMRRLSAYFWDCFPYDCKCIPSLAGV